MTDNKRKKLAYILLVVSIIFMILNFATIDYSNFEYKKLLGPLTNIFLILSMYLVIRDINKNSND